MAIIEQSILEAKQAISDLLDVVNAMTNEPFAQAVYVPFVKDGVLYGLRYIPNYEPKNGFSRRSDSLQTTHISIVEPGSNYDAYLITVGCQIEKDEIAARDYHLDSYRSNFALVTSGVHTRREFSGQGFANSLMIMSEPILRNIFLRAKRKSPDLSRANVEIKDASGNGWSSAWAQALGYDFHYYSKDDHYAVWGKSYDLQPIPVIQEKKFKKLRMILDSLLHARGNL